LEGIFLSGIESGKRKPDFKENEKELKKYQKAIKTLSNASDSVLEQARTAFANDLRNFRYIFGLPEGGFRLPSGFEYLFTGVAGSEWRIATEAKTTLNGCYLETGWGLVPATVELIISGNVRRTSYGAALIFDRAGDILGQVEHHYVQGKVVSIFWKRKLIARRRK
jgi:hypothetical protein